MLQKFKLKQARLVPFLNTLMHRNLITSPVGRSSLFRLKR